VAPTIERIGSGCPSNPMRVLIRLTAPSDASSHLSNSALGFDPIWFALITLLSLEISFTTPPFGLLLFVMKGVSPPETTMREIYTSAFPYIFCSLFLVILLIVFPQIALWLPAL